MDSTFLPTLQGPIRDETRIAIIERIVAAGLHPRNIRKVTKTIAADDETGEPLTLVRLEFDGMNRGLIVRIPGQF